MGRFVHHEPCPRCGSRDNLGRFDDGGAFCFGCHYSERATHAPFRYMASTNEDGEKDHRKMPDDIGTNFGSAAVEWLARFRVDVSTAIANGLVWSPSREQLIFQLGDCWQARNFGEPRDGRKYVKNYTSGDVNECLFVYQSGGALSGEHVETRLVIVEDPVSALRIGRQCPAMPLLGSHLAEARMIALTALYDEIIMWLDSDKLKESRSISRRLQLAGVQSRTVFTDLDPKCHDDVTIQQHLSQ